MSGGELEASLASIVARFNGHVEAHPSVREELGSLRRTIAVRLREGDSYAVDLRDGRLENLRSPAPDRADVTVRTDRATFQGLVRREIGPMKAIVTGRLRLDGSLEDKLLFRKLLG
ncbi:MAG: SCP2 sterol-binding domain-containing protein [Thermoplasmata archaeon]